MQAAGDEADLDPRPVKLDAEIAADRPGAIDAEFHGRAFLPMSWRQRPLSSRARLWWYTKYLLSIDPRTKSAKADRTTLDSRPRYTCGQPPTGSIAVGNAGPRAIEGLPMSFPQIDVK